MTLHASGYRCDSVQADFAKLGGLNPHLPDEVRLVQQDAGEHHLGLLAAHIPVLAAARQTARDAVEMTRRIWRAAPTAGKTSSRPAPRSSVCA
jgi:hypothetical protein